MNKQELLLQLRKEDEVVLLELLELSSDDLVDAFLDRIEENADKIARMYEEEL